MSSNSLTKSSSEKFVGWSITFACVLEVPSIETSSFLEFSISNSVGVFSSVIGCSLVWFTEVIFSSIDTGSDAFFSVLDSSEVNFSDALSSWFVFSVGNITSLFSSVDFSSITGSSDDTSSVTLSSSVFSSVLSFSSDAFSVTFSSVLNSSVNVDELSPFMSLDFSSFWELFDCAFTKSSLDTSSAFASSPKPNNSVAPTKIEAVPTVNFLIEYLFNLLEIKSILPLLDFGFFFIIHSS